jgi:hypothetical protein
MPRKQRKPEKKNRWTNRRVQVLAGGTIAALIVFGLIIPVGAMQFENHDTFCASCHTEGETTFLQRAMTQPAHDLASFHAQKGNTRCIDCHSGAGLVGRYVTLTYGASDLVSYFRGHYPQPAVQDTPIGDANCLKCHSTVLDNQDFSNHFHAFLQKWQALDPTNAAHCVDCHPSHDNTGDLSAAFLNQNSAVLFCQKCHQFAGQG